MALALLAPSAASAHSVYVASIFSDGVFGYSIGSGGRLTPIPSSPFSDDSIAPIGVAISPDAKYLYSTDLEADVVSAFAIAPDGSLSPVPGSPFATKASPWGVAVSPDGDNLYVANRSANSVSAYSIAADGSLTSVPGSPFKTGASLIDMGSNGVAVTPDGSHLYVTNMVEGTVSAFSIAADGSLTTLPGSPFEAENTARPVSVTPDGEYLYVGAADASIWAYSIGSDGALGEVEESPFPIVGQTVGLAITPDGAHLYGTHVGGGNTVWAYSIGSDGGLSTITGGPFPTGGIKGNSAAISPDGRYLYTTNFESHDVSAFSIGATGGLKAVPNSPFDTGNGALQIAVTPDQGPVAEFSAAGTPAGNPLSFDASGSSDPDGTVASYHWNFGDGQTAVTSTATTSHVYETPDDYTVTLTVIDDSGCSTVQTFTGQTMSCNGSPLAQISHQIAVPPGEPLNVATAGSGSGSVTSSPAGIDCPGNCTWAFEPGTQVTLTADSAAGSDFAGWSGGGCSGTGSCEVTVESDTQVTGTFEKLPAPKGCEGGSSCSPTDGPPPTGQTPIPAQLRIQRVSAQNGVVVGGTIARAARGKVRVKVSAYVDGRRIGVSRRARIVEGRWRARLGFLRTGGDQNATLFVTARFQGSPGVQGGQAKRRVRGMPPT